MSGLSLRPGIVRATSIGFPIGHLPIDWSSCLPAAARFVSNVGDPYDLTDTGCENTKLFEQHVINWSLDLVDAPHADRWGWVTSGSTEAIRHGLYLGRTRYPTAPLYVSAAAHPCVLGAADMLGLDVIVIPTLEHDQLDYDALADLADPTRPALVVATVGTTMCEAVDEVPRIRDVLRSVGVRDVWVHADAALSGVPLALDDRWSWMVRLGDVGDTAAADSVSFSGSKFPSVPVPCGALLCRRSDAQRVQRPITYASVRNPTTACSRPGITPLMLWSVIKQFDRAGLADAAALARATAARTHHQLRHAGIDAHRHPWGMTVTLPDPGDPLAARWSLARAGGRAHFIAMPGIGAEVLDTFTEELIFAHVTGDHERIARPPTSHPGNHP